MDLERCIVSNIFSCFSIFFELDANYCQLLLNLKVRPAHSDYADVDPALVLAPSSLCLCDVHKDGKLQQKRCNAYRPQLHHLVKIWPLPAPKNPRWRWLLTLCLSCISLSPYVQTDEDSRVRSCRQVDVEIFLCVRY